MRPETKNWMDSSEYDFTTAEHMLQTSRYIYVVFMCHLAIEKLLKAILHEVTGSLPPKTHDLIYLLKLADVEMPDHLLVFVGKINSASIVTRYPEDLSRILSAYPATVARDYFNQSREVLEWLKQDRRLTGF
jgi:HEPN domain-containing protein